MPASGILKVANVPAITTSEALGTPAIPLPTQLTMLLVLMLTSKGIAGVPRASLVVIAGTLATFNIPEAGIALLLGIDPLLDMGRSATNVVGNSIATAVVSKWEGELKEG